MHKTLALPPCGEVAGETHVVLHKRSAACPASTANPPTWTKAIRTEEVCQINIQQKTRRDYRCFQLRRPSMMPTTPQCRMATAPVGFVNRRDDRTSA
jgi:hypothetical protein